MGLKEDLQNIFSKFSNNIVEKLDELKSPEVQVVSVQMDPNTFSRTELEKVTATNQKWTTKDFPQLQFKNDLRKSTIVEEISLVPDTAFKTKGQCYVTIDDSVVILAKKTFDIFSNIQESKIKTNKTIKQDSKIKLFMRSSDGSAVGLTMQVTFGE